MQKKIITFIFLIIVGLQIGGASASTNISCPVEVEEIFQPLSQRIMLAMFGPEGSVSALDAGGKLTPIQKNRILAMSVSEREGCSSPIPASTAQTVTATLSYLYMVTMILWAYMMAAYAFDSAYLSQGKNTEKGESSESPLIKIIRGVVAFLITAPVVGIVAGEYGKDEPNDGSMSYTAVHSLMFKGMGYSINAAEEIDKSLKQRFSTSNPIYTVPEPSFPLKNHATHIMRESDGEEKGISGILDFGLCVVTSEQGGVNLSNIKENFRVTSSGYDIEFSQNTPYGDCDLKITLPRDTVTPEIIKDYNKKKGNLIALNYEQAEKQIAISLSRQLLDVSLGLATGFSSNVTSGDAYVGEKINTANSALSSLENWVQACPFTKTSANAFAAKYSVDDSGRLSVNSVSDYWKVAENCIGYLITAKLGYPKRADGDFISPSDSPFGGKLLKFDAAYLSRVSQTGEMQLVYPEIKSSRKLDARQYQVCSYSIEDGKGDNLDECVESICSLVDPDAPVTGIFECAVAVQAAQKDNYSNFFDSLGFIVTPSVIMTRLGRSDVASSPQSLLGGFDAQFKGSFSTKISQKDAFSSISDLNLDDHLSSLAKMNYKELSTNILNDPYADALSCLMNPSSIIEKKSLFGQRYNVVCQHPLNEIHNLGIYLLKTFAAYAAGVTARQAVSIASQRIKDKASVDDAGRKDGGITGDGSEIKDSKPKVSNHAEKSIKKEESKSWAKKVITWVVGGAALPTVLMVIVPVFDGKYPRGSLGTSSVMVGAALGLMVGGNVIVENAKEMSNLESAAANTKKDRITLVGITMLITGIVAAFIIPIIPAAIFYSALFSILANFLAMAFSVNFHILYALANTGGDIRKKLTSLFNKWVLLVLRLPLLVVGFYLSYSLMITILPEFASYSSEMLSSVGLGTFTSFTVVDEVMRWLLGVILFLFLFFLIMFAIFDAITGVFDLTRGLVFNDDSGEALGKGDSHSRMKENIQLFKSL